MMMMEKGPALTVQNFITFWNDNFSYYPLTSGDLDKPHKVISALLLVFDRLGIDEEAVSQAPTQDETNNHVMYYRDLIPVINMTRIINHLVSVMPQAGFSISINSLLQPSINTSYSILMMLSNIILFNEQGLIDIAPYEQELFSKSDEIKSLEKRKHRLLEMLNEQAEEKGKRVETLAKLDIDIKQFDEELKQAKETHDKVKQELDVILNENKHAEILLKQKKAHSDGLIAEVEKKRAQRVYDADDVKAQAEDEAQNVQEAEEKLNTLRATLIQKENCLKNLQAIKPDLDMANNLSHEIMKLSESMKDKDLDDLDTMDGEVEVLDTELNELETLLAELRASRAETAAKRKEGQARRQQERMLEKTNLAHAEEEERKHQEWAKKATERIQEIKQLTFEFTEQKEEGTSEVARIKDTFNTELRSFEDFIINKTLETKQRIQENIRTRNI